MLAFLYDDPLPGFTATLPLGSQGAVLYPVYLQVCAEYWGLTSVPTDPGAALRGATLCGILGQHVTPKIVHPAIEQNEGAPFDASTPMYVRVLSYLEDTYYKPKDDNPQAQIIIEPAPPDADKGKPHLINYHWGDERDEVNIAFIYDPRNGEGTVFFADRDLRRDLKRRHAGGQVNFPLYRMLLHNGVNTHETYWGPTGCMGLDCERRVDEPPDPRLRALFERHH
jgi:hypothetical protein